ncbi:hypothetical protein LXA47_31340 [Massilia sp. P8910]|uniref:phage scaffolding protein n=1 Tax=Massilia antarctica TaxID=2765360 RepID=UPI001E43994D|nr:hypothetical protein [Massilia antarctica]MCE3608066.1 hypothetical protein [Massilia antarctica]
MADADNSNTPDLDLDNDTPSKDGWQEHAKTLREENKQWRLKFREAESKLKAAEVAVESTKTEFGEKLTKAEVAANERLVRSELKAEALKAGMVDLDGLKLADLSGVKLGADGSVEGAEALMAALKEAKPYLFKQPQSSSSNPGGAPKADEGKAKSASSMSAEEYAKAKAEALRKARNG